MNLALYRIFPLMLQKRIKIIITVLSIWMVFNHVQAQYDGMKRLNFFVGDWSIETLDIMPDGQFQKNRGRSCATFFMDGHAMKDEYQILNETGKTIFQGLTIRSYNPVTKKYQIIWIMPGKTGITDITAEFINDIFMGKGTGYDEYGPFLERFEYYDIQENSYKFKMDRSYDNGKTWIINFGRYTAHRLK